jgi:CubicO group peptidase (beta-lactamase class C family)
MQAPEQETEIKADVPQLQGFDDFVRTIMQEWKLPGLAIAIVKDGNVIFSQGFGKRNIAQDLDVTPKTLFAIGSCTKAFTATAMGILVDEGKLGKRYHFPACATQRDDGKELSRTICR